MTEPDTKTSARRLGWVLGCLVLPALAAAFVLWYNANLNAQRMAARLEYRVETTVDPVLLRSWAIAQLSKTAAGPLERLPCLDEASRLETPQVGLFRHGDTNFVLVSWGAGTPRSDCCWGLAIGSTNFVAPKYPGWQSRAWKPGIYFWRDLDRHIPRSSREIEG